MSFGSNWKWWLMRLNTKEDDIVSSDKRKNFKVNWTSHGGVCVHVSVCDWVDEGLLARGASAMCAPVWASWLPAWLQMAQCLSAPLSSHADTKHRPHGHGQQPGLTRKRACQPGEEFSSYVELTMSNYGVVASQWTLFKKCIAWGWAKHTLAGVTAAGVHAHCEGRTTGASTWLGAWTHEVLSR